jgi:hypothetical protein
MPTSTRRPSPRPRDEQPERPARPPACNVTPCPEAPEWRGLCSAHRQTHRGLADPDPRKDDRP